MIKFIGTSHISPASINEVETTVLSYSPDIICLELDYGRFLVLTNQVKRKKYSFRYIRKRGGTLLGISNPSPEGKAVYDRSLSGQTP